MGASKTLVFKKLTRYSAVTFSTDRGETGGQGGLICRSIASAIDPNRAAGLQRFLV